MGFFSNFFNAEKLDAAPHGKPSETSDGSNSSDMGLNAVEAKAILAEIDLDTAIAAHENWKLRLQNYLDQKSTEDLRPEVVCLDDHCDLGKWLHGPGGQRLGKYPAFSVLIARHKSFHVHASTVVALAQSGNKEKASDLMEAGYHHTSRQVILLLRELKRSLARGLH
jgi:hypothetical protein